MAICKSSMLNLKTDLDQNGFVHIKKSCLRQEFILLAGSLGSCETFSYVNVIANSKTYINSESEIPLHSDCPLIRYVGWYCISQDDYDGASILSDGYAALSDLNENEIDSLQNTPILYPDYKSKKFYETMILSSSEDKQSIYYAPWLVKNNFSNSFLESFDKKLNSIVFSIRLRQGEMLFIDNLRMLHGRKAISLNSKRFLERVWIR